MSDDDDGRIRLTSDGAKFTKDPEVDKALLCHHCKPPRPFKNIGGRVSHERSIHKVGLPVPKPVETNSGDLDKAAAVALLDLFGGDEHRVSLITGQDKKVIKEWRKEMVGRGKLDGELGDPRLAVIAKFKLFLDAMMTMMILRARNATIPQLYTTMGIVGDKLDNLTGEPIADNAKYPRHPAAPPRKPPPVQAAEPESSPVEEGEEKQKWHDIVDAMVRETGGKANREEIIKTLCQQRPEAAQYFKVAVAVAEADEETEAVN